MQTGDDIHGGGRTSDTRAPGVLLADSVHG
jgi:hypothetical protein